MAISPRVARSYGWLAARPWRCAITPLDYPRGISPPPDEREEAEINARSAQFWIEAQFSAKLTVSGIFGSYQLLATSAITAPIDASLFTTSSLSLLQRRRELDWVWIALGRPSSLIDCRGAHSALIRCKGK